MPKINTEIKQGSDQWFAAKVGKPSASSASRLITSVGGISKSMTVYAQELAAELYAGHSLSEWKGSDATEFGKKTEEEARLSYSLLMDSDISECGFIEDDLQQYIISPDGLLSDHEGDGMAEYKCKPKHHLTTLIYYKKHGHIPPDYIAQCQMQLFVSGRAWVDLYYYSPDLPKLRVRQYPDPKIFAGLKSQLAACIATRNIALSTLRSF